MKAEDPEAVERRVGRRIAEIRVDRGLTQYDLAIECELSEQQIRRIELASNTRLTVRRLVELAQALGVEPAELLEPPRDARPPRPGRPSKR